MKKILWVLIFAGLAPWTAWGDVTKDDVRRVIQAGLSEDLVLAYIRADGPVARLTADDLVDLKAWGASDRILAALLVVPPARTQTTASGGTYLYDSRFREWVPLNPSSVILPICDWGSTFTTVSPFCRSRNPVCRPICVQSPRCPVTFRR